MDIVRIASQHIPISVNRAYRNATAKDRVKHRIKTKDYGTWARAFGWDVQAAMARQKPIKGPYTIEVTVCRSKRHPLADVTNFEKPLQDCLGELGVIENDRFCEHFGIGWGEAQGGVVIEIKPFQSPSNPKRKGNEI